MEWAKTAEDIPDEALAAFIHRAEKKLDEWEKGGRAFATEAGYLADALTNLEQALRQRDVARTQRDALLGVVEDVRRIALGCGSDTERQIVLASIIAQCTTALAKAKGEKCAACGGQGWTGAPRAGGQYRCGFCAGTGYLLPAKGDT